MHRGVGIAHRAAAGSRVGVGTAAEIRNGIRVVTRITVNIGAPKRIDAIVIEWLADIIGVMGSV